MVYKRTLAS